MEMYVRIEQNGKKEEFDEFVVLCKSEGENFCSVSQSEQKAFNLCEGKRFFVHPPNLGTKINGTEYGIKELLSSWGGFIFDNDSDALPEKNLHMYQSYIIISAKTPITGKMPRGLSKVIKINRDLGAPIVTSLFVEELVKGACLLYTSPSPRD